MQKPWVLFWRYAFCSAALLCLWVAFALVVMPPEATAEPAPAGKPAVALAVSQGRPAQVTATVFLPLVWSDFPKAPVFGVEYKTPITTGIMLTRLQELGATWARLGTWRVSWRELQPEENGPIHWELMTTFEDELHAARAVGVVTRVVIEDSPRWATITPTSCAAIRTDKFPHFASFVSALAARYSTYEFGLHDWELGNEPDVDPKLVPVDNGFGCWGDIADPYYGGERYGEMLKVVGPAIRNADPLARIWLGGLLLATPLTTDPNYGHPEVFLKGVLEVGGGEWLDVVAYHVYSSYRSSYTYKRVDLDNGVGGVWASRGGATVGKAGYLRDLLQSHGLNRPIVLNEAGLMCVYGVAGCPASDSYLDAQADYLVRSFVRGLSAGVSGLMWYTLDSPGWRSSNLVDHGGIRRPAFHAYRYLIGQLEYRPRPASVYYGDEIEAYAYPSGTETVNVLWARADITTSVVVTADRLLAAFDRTGQPLQVTPVEGGRSAPVTFSPVYLVLRAD